VLSLAYSNGLLSDVQGPLWRSGGAHGQHVTYGYNGSGQLTTLTRGVGTTDALTTTFAYSGTQRISVTTPYTSATRTWTLSYDAAGRLVSLASPVSGDGPGRLHPRLHDEQMSADSLVPLYECAIAPERIREYPSLTELEQMGLTRTTRARTYGTHRTAES
jgi:hypothetical protein